MSQLGDSEITAEFLAAARAGSAEAVEALLSRHARRLHRMITVRLSPALNGRVDPSDIVQESLLTASARLPQYLKVPSVAFYPWLRSIAADRLIDCRRRHLTAQRRSVLREERAESPISDDSLDELGDRLAGRASSPSRQALREESRVRVRHFVDSLPEVDREVLMLRYLEELSSSEIADVLKLSVRTVQLRHGRALEKLRELLEASSSVDRK